MMKRTLCIFLSVLVAVLLCGCQSENGLQQTYILKESFALGAPAVSEGTLTVDVVTPYTELLTKELDIHYFIQEYVNPLNMTGYARLDQIASDIGVECLRVNEAGTMYSVHKVKQGGLLYLFYNNAGGEDSLGRNYVLRWFYVREPVSSSQFDGLIVNESTMSDVISVCAEEQIFKNIYEADKTSWAELYSDSFFTWHYLEDGIMEISYQIVDGHLIVFQKQFHEDFCIVDMGEPLEIMYDVRILDMDWPA